MRRGGPARFAWPLLLAGAALGTARHAGATYSIVAVDTVTREVGGAGTSCLGGSNVYIIYGSVPGAGVVHAQATFSQAGRDRAVELLRQRTAPDQILTSITSASFDRNASVRQYAVADLDGRVAAYTGDGTQSYAGDRQGIAGSFVYSVQGNILTGQAVLQQAATAFESGGCDLAERLVRALEAGTLGGQGDSRCTPDGIPADSAFVQVDREGEPAGSYLELHVPSSGNADPLVELRTDFDDWRASHPCPAPPAGAGGGPTGAAGAGNGGRGFDGRAGMGGVSAMGGTGVIGSGAGGMQASHPPESEDSGCGCRTVPRGSAPGAAFWGILAFSLAVSRRWNRSTHRC
jgi:MYXO-CTERM domain-containing protein